MNTLKIMGLPRRFAPRNDNILMFRNLPQFNHISPHVRQNQGSLFPLVVLVA